MAGEGSYPSSIHPASTNRWVVPSVGVEPTRPCGHLILSQARLPVSPRGILIGISVLYTMRQLFAISLACEMIIVVLVANLSSVVVDGVAICGVGHSDVLGDRLVT